jgi:hypothetical protein
MACVRERTVPNERPPLVGEISAKFVDKRRHMVSPTDPYGRILGFLDRSRYSLSSSSSVVLMRLRAPRSRLTNSQKISKRHESNPNLWICSQELERYTTEAVHFLLHNVHILFIPHRKHKTSPVARNSDD